MTAGQKLISARVDDETARRFALFCAQNGLSRSEGARHLLATALVRSQSPLTKSSLALQARVCSELGKQHARFTREALGLLRRLVPEG